MDEKHELLLDDHSGIVDNQILNADIRSSSFETYGKTPRGLVTKQITVKLEISRYRVLEQKITQNDANTYFPLPLADICNFSKSNL